MNTSLYVGVISVLALYPKWVPAGLRHQDHADILKRIKLELTSVQERFDRSSIVPIRVRFHNASNATVKLPLDLGMPMGVELYWTDPDGAKSRVQFLHERVSSTGSFSAEIQPGSCFQGTLFASPSILRENPYDRLGFKAPKVGSWSLSAVYTNEAGSVKANDLKITIEESTRTLESHEEIFKGERWHRFAAGQEIKADELATFKEYVRSASVSPQKDIMGYIVGRRLENKLKAADAYEVFNKVLHSVPSNVSRSQLQLRMAHCCLNLERFDEALGLLQQVDTTAIDGPANRVRELTDIALKGNERKAKERK